jgi:hypothetical protein
MSRPYSELIGVRYNGMWTKDIQNVIFAILMCGWLGGMATKDKPAEVGRLLTIDEVGGVLNGEFTQVFTNNTLSTVYIQSSI